MSGITVVSTALNAEQWAGLCIDSVKCQRHRARRHVYIDACSNDQTVAVANAAKGRDGTVEVVAKLERKPLLANLVPVIRELPPDEIVVWLDGDDWLATDHALARVAREYEDERVQATYGQFMWSNGRIGFASSYPSDVVHRNQYRQWHWFATHLKTFKAGLFQKLTDQDLQEDDGRWFELAVDQAIMLPLLEHAGPGGHRFIPDILCVYNAGHAFDQNTDAVGLQRERETCLRIRAREPVARPT